MAAHRSPLSLGFALLALVWPFQQDRHAQDPLAQDLRGAKKIIEQISDNADKITLQDGDDEFARRLQKLPQEFAKKTPQQSAALWIELEHRWYVESAATSYSMVIGALPSPESWPELVRQVELQGEEASDARLRNRELCRKALIYRLVNDQASLREVLREAEQNAQDYLQKLNEKYPDGPPDEDQHWAEESLDHIHELEEVVNPLWQVDRMKEAFAKPAQSDRVEVKVPDLVPLVGREEAAKLIEQGLLHPGVALTFNYGLFLDPPNETLALAMEIAKKNIDKLVRPTWALCHSIDSVELYERFQTLLPTSFISASEEERADNWYILGLVKQNRIDDAVKFIEDKAANHQDRGYARNRFSTELNYYAFGVMRREGKVQELQTFLRKMVDRYPDFHVENGLFHCVRELGGDEAAIKLIDELLVSGKGKNTAGNALAIRRAKILIDQGRIDEGVKALIELLDGGSGIYASDAVEFARLGKLIDRKDLTTRATTVAESLISARNDVANDASEFALFLREQGDFTKAEDILSKTLSNLVSKQRRDIERPPYSGYAPDSSLAFLLKQLAATYFDAKRYADVVDVLEQAPWWGMSDLAQDTTGYLTYNVDHVGKPRDHLPYIAAESLSQVARTAEARKLAEAIVLQAPKHDPTWELLLKLAPDEFEKIAAKASKVDPYEDRPFIWLAKFHVQQGNLAKANAAIQKAIQLDPSDNDQPHGARLLAYAALAQIHRAQGKETDAKIYEEAVTAIRIAETADDLLNAGLQRRGVKRYDEALTHFADAYCIQSRLAIQKDSLGASADAEKHYQRAFELMPKSFGDFEIDCTGCGGIFYTKLAQDTAERVFKRLLEADPKNPRLHYLLGKLEGASEKGIASLKKAVELDPDYLSAWNLLHSLDYFFPESEKSLREETVYALLRLDPQGRHTHPDLDQIQDLAKFWRFTHAAAANSPPREPLKMFRLKSVPYDPLRAKQQAAMSRGDRVRFEWHQQLSLFAQWMEMGERQ